MKRGTKEAASDQREIERVQQGQDLLATVRKEEKLSGQSYSPGWDEERIWRILEHYEEQSDQEAIAEDEAAYESVSETMVSVPCELVPAVLDLIAQRTG